MKKMLAAIVEQPNSTPSLFHRDSGGRDPVQRMHERGRTDRAGEVAGLRGRAGSGD